MRPVAKVLAAAGVAAAAIWYLAGGPGPGAAVEFNGPPIASQQPTAVLQAGGGQDAARQAFNERASGRQLHVEGRVLRLLADDREGSPHQRFIIATGSGQTLLVAHNLDLAPRLDGLAVGDRVSLYGEYEWNEQGGVMHWTHDDPRGNHPHGYIDWNGRRFQ